MKNNNKKLIYHIIILFLTSLFYSFETKADLHIQYKNKKKEAKKIEIFSKNSLFKVITTDNSVKIVNLLEEEVFLYKNDDNKYLQLALKQEDESRKNKKELFSPTIEILKDKKPISGFLTGLLKYKSNIDRSMNVYVNKLIPGSEISMLKICIGHLSSKGMEILKSPAYYYALENGFIPLRIRGKEIDWIATDVKTDPLSEETFTVPEKMKRWEIKDYYRKIVEKVSEGMDSKVNP